MPALTTPTPTPAAAPANTALFAKPGESILDYETRLGGGTQSANYNPTAGRAPGSANRRPRPLILSRLLREGHKANPLQPIRSALHKTTPRLPQATARMRTLFQSSPRHHRTRRISITTLTHRPDSTPFNKKSTRRIATSRPRLELSTMIRGSMKRTVLAAQRIFRPSPRATLRTFRLNMTPG